MENNTVSESIDLIFERIIDFFYKILTVLTKPEVLSALVVLILMLYCYKKLLVHIIEENYENKEYKNNYEKKLEVVKDAERILEIKEEFDNLNWELKNIQQKYRKNLFSFLKK